MTRRLAVLSCVLVAALALSTTMAFAADMFSGTWKTNVAKSKYSPGPAPKSGIQTVTAADGGYKVVADGVNSEGKKTHDEYTFKMDGKDYPRHPMLDGKADPSAPDMASARKIDDYSYEATTKLKGKTLLVSKVVISKDGKTRTVTQTGKNAKGETVSNTIVTEKQ
jgi:hypothetical protein